MYNAKDIGARIKQLRDSAAMTQSELGKFLGVTDRAVSTWELGLAMPRMGKVQKMADRFGVTVSWIIEGESATLTALENQIDSNSEQTRLLEAIADFSNKEMEELIMYAEIIKMRR